MVLCENRPEGFGPRSSFTTHLPTTCFADVIVVPLATWVYLIALALAIATGLPSSIASRTNSGTTAASKHEHQPVGTSKNRMVLSKVLIYAYYFLIIAMLALNSVEIARAAGARLGIGLLPFTYVGLVVACILHFSAHDVHPLQKRSSGHRVLDIASGPRWRWLVRSANGLYWILLICAMTIKLATEAEEQRVAGLRTGEQAKYPLSDAITDDAVMIGLELVLLIIEILG